MGEPALQFRKGDFDQKGIDYEREKELEKKMSLFLLDLRYKTPQEILNIVNNPEFDRAVLDLDKVRFRTRDYVIKMIEFGEGISEVIEFQRAVNVPNGDIEIELATLFIHSEREDIKQDIKNYYPNIPEDHKLIETVKSSIIERLIIKLEFDEAIKFMVEKNIPFSFLQKESIQETMDYTISSLGYSFGTKSLFQNLIFFHENGISINNEILREGVLDSIKSLVKTRDWGLVAKYQKIFEFSFEDLSGLLSRLYRFVSPDEIHDLLNAFAIPEETFKEIFLPKLIPYFKNDLFVDYKKSDLESLIEFGVFTKLEIVEVLTEYFWNQLSLGSFNRTIEYATKLGFPLGLMKEKIMSTLKYHPKDIYRIYPENLHLLINNGVLTRYELFELLEAGNEDFHDSGLVENSCDILREFDIKVSDFEDLDENSLKEIIGLIEFGFVSNEEGFALAPFTEIPEAMEKVMEVFEKAGATMGRFIYNLDVDFSEVGFEELTKKFQNQIDLEKFSVYINFSDVKGSYIEKKRYSGLLRFMSLVQEGIGFSEEEAEAELKNLIENENYATATDFIKCMEYAGYPVDETLRDNVILRSEEEIKKRESRETREYDRTEKVVIDEIAEFYVNDLILKEAKNIQDRLITANIEFPRAVDRAELYWLINRLQGQTEKTFDWMKEYIVKAVASELKHQTKIQDGCENDVLIPNTERSTDEQIRIFLLSARNRFENWTLTYSGYGGKAWAEIADHAIKMWNDEVADSVAVDHVFDLEHNSGMIFDKDQDWIKPNHTNDEKLLDWKRSSVGLDNLIIGVKLYASTHVGEKLERRIATLRRLQKLVDIPDSGKKYWRGHAGGD